MPLRLGSGGDAARLLPSPAADGRVLHRCRWRARAPSAVSGGGAASTARRAYLTSSAHAGQKPRVAALRDCHWLRRRALAPEMGGQATRRTLITTSGPLRGDP